MMFTARVNPTLRVSVPPTEPGEGAQCMWTNWEVFAEAWEKELQSGCVFPAGLALTLI